MKIASKLIAVLLIVGILFIPSHSSGQDGAALFKETCSACHKLGQRLVGPDLLGVNQKRSEDWLLSFVKSSQSMVKAGDAEALAIFKEYNELVMPDQAYFSDNEIRAIFAYIEAETPVESESNVAEGFEVEKVEVTPPVPIVYTEEDANFGKEYFTGELSLKHGGPSCISCHNVENDELTSGGVLAKDLTNVYERMGDAGLAGILGSPPFPAMAIAYENYQLDSAEIVKLTAFLKRADKVSEDQQDLTMDGDNILLLGGGGGLVLLFLIIGLHWNTRIKTNTKHDIYRRTIKGNDSVI